ncbi:MAG: ATP-binding cassette domain-containing protein [Neisseria sp.]|nr:ATP-binding cassette domain-containing protein [Neisseria sp.]
MNTDAAVLLSAHGLTRVAEEGKVLLQPADFSVCAGDKIGVEGASGSGKSVLLRTMALLDWPNGGELRWQGKAVAGRAAAEAYRTRVAYVRQQPSLLPGSVADNLNIPFTLAAYRGQKQDEARIQDMLKRIGRTAHFLEGDSANLSGGEAQLVCLMRVLQLNPQVLLLDEPTAALDPESAEAVETLVYDWQQKREQAGAYVWISHSPEQLARISATVWHVAAGKLTVGAHHA